MPRGGFRKIEMKKLLIQTVIKFGKSKENQPAYEQDLITTIRGVQIGAYELCRSIQFNCLICHLMNRLQAR